MASRAFTPSVALVPVLAAWGLATALVGVGGEFPLSDDWAYAHVVRSLCEGRGLDFLPWTGASLIVQALYGAATCLAGGFSHETLRMTTLAASAVGLLSFHGLLGRLGASTRVAAAGAALLAFSPLWFSLSLTFMTDVPFAALALLAAWLYTRALAAPSPSRDALVLASTAAAASFLVRQHGLWIAVAAALVAAFPVRSARSVPLAAHDDTTGRRFKDAAAALALPFLVAAAWALWTAVAGDVPQAVRNKLGEAVTTSAPAVAGAAFRALATLGFLFAPWALLLRLDTGRARRVFAASLALLTTAAVFLFAREGASMFYLTNVMDAWSLGAVTTRDVLFLSLPEQTGSNVAAAIGRLLLTALSLASASALLAGLAASWTAVRGETSSSGSSRAVLFCIVALALSGLGTLAQAHYYFDRYVLVLLPLAMAATVPAVSIDACRPATLAAAATGLALAFYSVAGTHDYMEWNRARWQLLADLEARGVAAERIDGGVEYNASRLAARLRTAPTDAEARRGQAASEKSWWWVVDDEWVIAFTPLEGYAVSDSRTFARWLPPGRGRLLSLRREPGGADAPEDLGTP